MPAQAAAKTNDSLPRPPFACRGWANLRATRCAQPTRARAKGSPAPLALRESSESNPGLLAPCASHLQKAAQPAGCQHHQWRRAFCGPQKGPANLSASLNQLAGKLDTRSSLAGRETPRWPVLGSPPAAPLVSARAEQEEVAAESGLSDQVAAIGRQGATRLMVCHTSEREREAAAGATCQRPG